MLGEESGALGARANLGGETVRILGDLGGGVTPAQSASVEENNPCEETAFQQASPCKLSTLQNFSKTAKFSSPQSLQKPQTFHFSAEPPHSFGRRKVFKNRKLFISLRSTANFSLVGRLA